MPTAAPLNGESSVQKDQNHLPEVHFSVVQVAKLWNISPDLARQLFRQEPGVLKIERPRGRFKRVYTTLRIPQSVLNRVYTRLSSDA
jgi:hypothetical protein